jgi:replicative DNA helicase
MIDTKEHEISIIGAMLALGEEPIIAALDNLTADHFTYTPARSVFDAFKFLYDNEGIVPTDSDIYTFLAKSGAKVSQADLNDFLNLATTNHDWHIETLIDAHQRRMMRRTALTYTQKLESSEQTAYEYAEMMMQEIQSTIERNASSYSHISDIAKLVADPSRIRPSLKTGFYDLDQITSGFYPKEYIVVGARPSTGKTALMTNMAYNIAMTGIPVGIFSLEMSSEAVVNRIVCGLSNVNMHSKLEGKLTDYQQSRIQAVSQDVAKLPIFIDDTSAPTAQYIRSTCRKWLRTYGVSVVFIDYLTKITSAGDKATDNREREVSRISLQLKDTAKDLGISLVVMSQLSRQSEQRSDRRPVSSDLRDSGQIEQDADKILLLHKPGIGKSTMKGNDGSKYIEILVAKNRNGRVGACELYYDAEAMTFRNINNNKSYEDYEPQF